MNPEAALDRQIARYREMTTEQRVLTALRLHELACEMEQSLSGVRVPNTHELSLAPRTRPAIPTPGFFD